MRSTVTLRRDNATASASAGNKCPPVPPAATITRGEQLRFCITSHSTPRRPDPETAGFSPPPYHPCLAGDGREAAAAAVPRADVREGKPATCPYRRRVRSSRNRH